MMMISQITRMIMKTVMMMKIMKIMIDKAEGLILQGIEILTEIVREDLPLEAVSVAEVRDLEAEDQTAGIQGDLIVVEGVQTQVQADHAAVILEVILVEAAPAQEEVVLTVETHLIREDREDLEILTVQEEVPTLVRENRDLHQ